MSAYDKVFDGIKDDAALVTFLRGKNPNKLNFAGIQKEYRGPLTARHPLEHPINIRTNYPGTERAQTLIRTVLEWPGNRGQLREELDAITRKAVAVDGVSGEKGLASYGSIAPRDLAEILGEYARLDEGLIPEMLQRNPKLRSTYRFHFDTWINHEYYPNSGDAGAFTKKQASYAGLVFEGPVYRASWGGWRRLRAIRCTGNWRGSATVRRPMVCRMTSSRRTRRDMRARRRRRWSGMACGRRWRRSTKRSGGSRFCGIARRRMRRCGWITIQFRKGH